MGSFPRSFRQNKYFSVIVDYCTKWVELFLPHPAMAASVANIIIRDIFTRWGTPVYLFSDCSPYFMFNAICKLWGVTQKLTTAYHLQTNLSERINRNLIFMIAAYVKGNHPPWERWIPELHFALNTVWHRSTGYTPSNLTTQST